MVRDFIKKNKAGIVFLGDIVVFFGSLALTLSVRYGRSRYSGAFQAHLRPFSLLLVLWLLVFYIADLYAYTTWRTTFENGKRFAIALLVNFFLSISIFYLFSQFFKLTPKLNLVIFTVVFGVIDCAWRYLLARMLASKNHKHSVILIAATPLAKEIEDYARRYPESGYAIHRYATAEEAVAALKKGHGKAAIVIDRAFLKNTAVMTAAYERAGASGRIETFADFYGGIFGRVPLSEVSEEWFIKEANAGGGLYDAGKRVTDAALAIVAIVILSPVFLVLFILIPLTTEGPAIYQQKRIGRDGSKFTIYKFRNMYSSAERNPDTKGTAPVWWQKDDPRVTPLGRTLRKAHLDELPQLWNILRGDMSFVGPRPERPEFVASLKEDIPHYALRETIQPGLTGWAQIKYRYAGTVGEWKEKFEYDLYYLQHRSFLIDAGVIAKTVQFVLFTR